ncbi:TPA_asm: hypothetical protein G4L32_000788 [Salmonella enterica subsp. diarizonae serovar 50:z:z52]|nr:hypothetical protein [Salmonella enterica subsp. diarizonae serovar 50:z:z52]
MISATTVWAGCNWRVHESFAFYLSDDNSDVIEVPAGFVTDLILLDGMTVLGVPKWKRTVMYWVGGLLSAMLFILTYLLNQYRNNVKANEKDDKDQKERLNCCEYGM